MNESDHVQIYTCNAETQQCLSLVSCRIMIAGQSDRISTAAVLRELAVRVCNGAAGGARWSWWR